MAVAKQIFEEYYAELLRSAHDRDISLGLSRSVNAYRQRKYRALSKFPYTIELAKEVRGLKEDWIGRLDQIVQLASETLKENGAQVYHAESAEDALKVIGEIVGSGKLAVMGKTLTGEEIGLRQYLEGLGNEVWETDTAELIQQLRKEKPMHYVYPSLHVPREGVAKVLTDLLGREIPPDIPTEVTTIRQFLRGKYFKADIGISGCNVLAADTGSILLLESEGNIRMSTNVPPVHIVLVGIDKVAPSLSEAFKVAEVTWRYAGFTIPWYISVVSAPSATADIELTLIRGASGPVELHVVFLDNGRSMLAKDTVFKEALYCIRCGGCLLECPVFQLTAGHYGHKYFGGIGAIWTAYIAGDLAIAAPITYTCLRCGRCTEECPMSIDMPKLTVELRKRIMDIARS